MPGKKSNASYIVFAVKQALAAEAYGFTRNECCRNLKTALHQYWQHKTMGLHSQAKKKDIPRSKAALGLPLSKCVVEHVVPQMEIVNRLLDLEPLNESTVENLLKKLYLVRLVTYDEHAALNREGFRSTMPEDWDGINLYARHDLVGIEYE